MKKKKGFTFIELIIVLAIIAILTAVLVPTWGYFLNRARTRQNNATARIVFNAAQTAVVEMNTNERNLHVAADQRYVTPTFYFYWNGRTGFRCDSDGNQDTTANPNSDAIFADSINRILDHPEYAYKIFVSDNKVEAVSAGRNEGDVYVGVYPISLQDAEDQGMIDSGTHRNIRRGAAVGVPLDQFSV
ncbi:MAG: prepilin-type N-terminal cleavage/methylation domain-containing protein [Oscillospiraceae bacterium]|nr:prepilin-type N-terminal cleavage/methylation domain-containing protein [Oscillospiraceae bacterium]